MAWKIKNMKGWWNFLKNGLIFSILSTTETFPGIKNETKGRVRTTDGAYLINSIQK